MIKNPLFYAKILLFGEYGIIKDSMGLSIPYNSYKGNFILPQNSEDIDEKALKSNTNILKLYTYLLDLQQNNNFDKLDLIALKSDIDNKMYFESSIPEGFGVGSSGALVAAIYNRYAIDPILPSQINNKSLKELKSIFGLIESYFHGKSSGLDPVICYLNIPILLKADKEMDAIGLPESTQNGAGAIFLLNSGTPGHTQSMVSIFMEKLKQKGFRNTVKNELVKYNDACIKAFLNNDIKPLFGNVKQLSALFLKHFSPMIPQKFKKVWTNGLETNSYYLKLCGSGGGGYVLGFTEDLQKAKKELKGHNLEVIYRF